MIDEFLKDQELKEFAISLIKRGTCFIANLKTSSMSKYKERNAMALLSVASRLSIDPASEDLLSYSCRHKAVKEWGLWNV